ncbi:MAG TPA: M20 family metallopeptidase [Candidatus Binatia bacterium]|jgi:succinyl-diaminopimelate desuccinylase|nr:M20 family metallopeptidase [Candidatus Binatia bacterium]
MDALDLTRELLGLDTINPPGQERACADRLGGLLEEAGFTVRRYEFAPGRTSLIARLGGASDRAPLCFAGHIDTVPLGAARWSHDPFAGELADGRLYGRGSSDMKSGVAAFVTAACRLADRLRNTAGLVLVIVAGEETGCEGSRYLASLNGVLGTAGAIVVAEPTGNYPCVGHKGALWLHARATGVTAHGSMPERGVNAIYKGARAVTKLERWAFDVPPHPVLGSPTLNVGTITGGLNINSVPDGVTIGVDIRTVPDQKHDDLARHLAAYLGDEITLTPIVDAEGVWTDPADPWMQEVFDLTTPILGTRPTLRGTPYFTDASALTAAYGGPPTVILGPGELELAHQTDEYCLVERIDQAVELYIELTRRWCGL